MPRSPNRRITAFDLTPGGMIGDKYRIDTKLGSGWEGEVYRVTETRTGIRRAAKLFYPQRNRNDRAVKLYAKKLDRLRTCSMVIQYLHSEVVQAQGQSVTCLISEYVEGELLERFVHRHRGRRLPPFKAMHLIYTLACGLEEIHDAGEYHGDLHEDNVLVRPQGIFFAIKLVDFYHHGAATRARQQEDVANLVRLLYEAVGGRKHYPNQPPEIKAICRGLRSDLICKSFPTMGHLREYLETADGVG